MRLVEAILIKRETNDGLVEVHKYVKLGKKYIVDLDSKSIQRGYNFVEGKIWEREGIFTKGGEWLPTEILMIGEDVI